MPQIIVPGFEQTPIEWTREYWNTRRLLRALWLFVTLGTLIALAGAPLFFFVGLVTPFPSRGACLGAVGPTRHTDDVLCCVV